MLAVVEIAGKQYIAREGETFRVEKLDAEEGKKVTLANVLLLASEKGTKLGTPNVSGAKVEAEVVSHGRDKKVWGIKHKAKKRYKVKFGHKQPHTMVKVVAIAG